VKPEIFPVEQTG